jgi:hypothetical protein
VEAYPCGVKKGEIPAPFQVPPPRDGNPDRAGADRNAHVFCTTAVLYENLADAFDVECHGWRILALMQ